MLRLYLRRSSSCWLQRPGPPKCTVRTLKRKLRRSSVACGCYRFSITWSNWRSWAYARRVPAAASLSLPRGLLSDHIHFHAYRERGRLSVTLACRHQTPRHPSLGLTAVAMEGHSWRETACVYTSRSKTTIASTGCACSACDSGSRKPKQHSNESRLIQLRLNAKRARYLQGLQHCEVALLACGAMPCICLSPWHIQRASGQSQ